MVSYRVTDGSAGVYYSLDYNDVDHRQGRQHDSTTSPEPALHLNDHWLVKLEGTTWPAPGALADAHDNAPSRSSTDTGPLSSEMTAYF